MQVATIARQEGEAGPRFVAGGCWDISQAAALDRQLAALSQPAGGPVVLDLGGIDAMDTAGAWLVHRTLRQWRAAGLEAAYTGASPALQGLLTEVADGDRPLPPEPAGLPWPIAMVAGLGRLTVDLVLQSRDFVAFFGQVVVGLLRTLARPQRLRSVSLVYHMQQVGLNALPVVGLISFLIGVVIAYQGASQLRQLGANIYVVDLIGVSVLRELGILLTAIVVAGRSGSAFTAQIGSMKLREELDAMRTLGIDPLDTLVLPRLLALVLTLPLMGFFADMCGLMGGAMMAWSSLDIHPAVFVERLSSNVGMGHFLVGMIKAPFFAGLIALVGCFEGLQVTGSAESVGRRTTRAVVESIFLVIIADAAFSIFFNMVNL